MIDDLKDDLNDSKDIFEDPNENITTLDAGTPLSKRTPPNELSNLENDEEEHQKPINLSTEGLSPNVATEEEKTERPKVLQAVVHNEDLKIVKLAEEMEDKFVKLDENRLLVKSYLHDLLRYINKNDATLANDEDGNLSFFIKQMPAEELEIPFPEWINKKVEVVKKEFIVDYNRKLELLKSQLDHTQDYIESLTDDESLFGIAEKLGVL